jgi:hypothetical protein
LRIAKGPVDAMLVRVAVHEEHGLAEPRGDLGSARG